MISFILNRTEFNTDLPGGETVLSLLRNEAGLRGTKASCREGDCGACTVLLGRPESEGIRYRAVNSCLLPVGELAGCHLVTIEGLDSHGDLTVVQQLIAENGASQCGFCTPGMVMSLTGYFLESLDPNPDGAILSLGGNICRCTGYLSLKRVASLLCEKTGSSPADNSYSQEHLSWLVEQRVLPDYFTGVKIMLKKDIRESEESCSAEDSTCIQLVAGGTDLFSLSPEELKTARIRFLSRDDDLRVIRIDDGICTIGAASTVSEIMESGIFRDMISFDKVFRLISSTQIRNRATVGGNIVNASPIGDLTIVFLALNANLILSGGTNERSVPLRRFYRDYKVFDLRPGEILREITFRIPEASSLFNFEKVSMREHMDIASVNSAALFSMDGNRIVKAGLSAGGIAPVPLYLEGTSSLLEGRELTAETVRMASEKAQDEVSPIDDVRGSAAYKSLLLGRLVTSHFMELFADCLEPEDLI